MKEERPHRMGEVTDAAHALMCAECSSNAVMMHCSVMQL